LVGRRFDDPILLRRRLLVTLAAAAPAQEQPRAAAGAAAGRHLRERLRTRRDRAGPVPRRLPDRTGRHGVEAARQHLLCGPVTALVGHLLADVGNLRAHLVHDPLDAAPDRKITARRASRRQVFGPRHFSAQAQIGGIWPC